MGPTEFYQSGQLPEAIEAAIAEVKSAPTDTAKRFQLCELFCFAGDLERADKQLDTIMQQTTEAAMQVTLARQLIRAETARQQFFQSGRLPEFISDPTPALRTHLDASIAIREGNLSEASDLLATAEEQRPHASGTCNDKPFDDFRDLDDLLAPFIEVLTSNGKYFWLPIESIESMEFRAPERPIDLVWRSVKISVASGPDGEVYFPTIYPQTSATGDNQLMLGRGTDWTNPDDGPVRGTGQKMFLVGDGDTTAMQLKNIEFASDD